MPNLQRTFIPFMLATIAILFGVAYGETQSIPTQVQTVDWNPNGNNIAVGFSNGIVQIVSADNQIETTFDASTNVVSVAWNPAGDKLAFANAHGGLWIWDSTTTQTTQINPQDEFIRAVAWSPDGVRLASANQSGTGPVAHNRVRIWDTTTGQLQITIEENIPDFYLNSIDWNPVDGNQLAAGTSNGAVVVWNTQSGESLHFSYPETDPSVGITTVAWNSDGTQLAAGATNGFTWVWNTTSWETEFSFAGGIIYEVEWSFDGRLAIADSNIVRVVEPETGQILGTEDAADVILALAWSPNGEKLAFGGITYSANPSIEIVPAPIAESPSPTNTPTR